MKEKKKTNVSDRVFHLMLTANKNFLFLTRSLRIFVSSAFYKEKKNRNTVIELNASNRAVCTVQGAM